jgi:pyruvate-ferredoxin/flavodoxin oxidoreductase
MTTATDVQKDAVESGFWPLFRYDPRLSDEGRNPLQLDSKAPAKDVADFVNAQNRFRALRASDPDRANRLLDALRGDVATRWKFYEQMANLDI